MELVTTVGELRAKLDELANARSGKAAGRRALRGLVPTMGALHAGHRSLLERMCHECGVNVVSIFVNPRQFGPREDLGRYPRTLPADIALCEAVGVHIVFAPAMDEVYPAGYCTNVHVAGLTERWCGAARPGHFDGVTTVVAKLFLMCAPDRAYFGEKDYQQLVAVRRMARDLDIPVEIAACPTVREVDELALSSRNAYLSPAERAVAPRLYAGLAGMQERFADGITSVRELVAAGEEIISGGSEAGPEGPAFRMEYLAVVDPSTLEPRETALAGDRALVAAYLGSTRLIDNVALGTEPNKVRGKC